MDKLNNYQLILADYLTKLAARNGSTQKNGLETRAIIDREHNAFQLLRMGWHGERFVFSVLFHFDIKDGKVWFQCNNTDREVVDDLMELGIAREDIVLGFHPPTVREYSGFAVA